MLPFSPLDGTINASERNPKPLREFLPHRTSGVGVSGPPEHRVSSVGVPAKGPSRPLPPTPDDDDTMRRGGNSSPAVRTNMPDLLPQTPTGPPAPHPRPSTDSPGGGQGSPHPSQADLQHREKSFLSFGFGAGSSVVENSVVPRRESHINVNVAPPHEFGTDTPEIRWEPSPPLSVSSLLFRLCTFFCTV